MGQAAATGGSNGRGAPPPAVRPWLDRGFTGHLHNDEVGLIYMNARYYVPSLGRFASADTIVPDAADPQSFNRFSYVTNNPLRFKDPTGHCGADIITHSDGTQTRDEALYAQCVAERDAFQQAHNILLNGEWTLRELQLVTEGLLAVQDWSGVKLSGYISSIMRDRTSADTGYYDPVTHKILLGRDGAISPIDGFMALTGWDEAYDGWIWDKYPEEASNYGIWSLTEGSSNVGAAEEDLGEHLAKYLAMDISPSPTAWVDIEMDRMDRIMEILPIMFYPETH